LIPASIALGDIKASLRLDYPNYAGALATAGNLVFLGHVDGTFSAYDAKTLKELWSFNAGTGINAPPITYAVNGKQYVAVLVGSRRSAFILAVSPELKNTSTASMLFVFAL
jgi:alcohol dehydrogenase (cytochrome c)